MNPIDRIEQLRARVAELEEKAERYRLTTLRQDATIAELATDGNAATLAANLAIVSQRNAELVAALREIIEWVDEDGADEKYDREIQRLCATALARAESVAPDHIPDAAKMVSAPPMTSKNLNRKFA